MNKQMTQFAVAVTGVVGLAVIATIATIGTVFYDGPSELAFMLVGGLLSLTSAAAAYLFRLNGTSRG